MVGAPPPFGSEATRYLPFVSMPTENGRKAGFGSCQKLTPRPSTSINFAGQSGYQRQEI